MITYLNEKYGENFIYVGYIESELMESEKLYAYPEQYGLDGGRNTVTVKVEDDGSFTDDYSSIEVRKYCQKLYDDFIKDYFNSNKAVIYINNFRCDINSLDEINNNDFENKVGGTNLIFISDEICDEEMLKDFLADFLEWSSGHGFHSSNRIDIFHDVDFSELTFNNCTDYYDNIIVGYTLSVYGDGTYSVYPETDMTNYGKNRGE